MTQSGKLILLATLGSLGSLLAALYFQYVMGLAPCPLCIWQRWPHLAAVLIGLGLVVLGWRWLTLAGAAACLTTAGIGAWHYGIEQKWWRGPDSCTGNSLAGVSASDLLNPAADVGAVVRCDEIAWSLMGISMPGWNVILSLCLAMVWIAAWRRA